MRSIPTESDDQNSLTSPENPEPQYTEVQTRQADPSRGEAASELSYFFVLLPYQHITVVLIWKNFCVCVL